jgi:glucose-6-phosphate isomerase
MEAIIMRPINGLKNLAQELKISLNECERVFIGAINEEKFSNRLAEVGKLSIENARQILERTKLGECDLSSGINYISAIIDENEIENVLLDSINDSAFINKICDLTQKDFEATIKSLERVGFKKVVLRYKINNPHEYTSGSTMIFINKPKESFHNSSPDLDFSKGKIKCVEFMGPNKEYDIEHVKIVHEMFDIVVDEMKKSLPIFKGGIKEYFEEFLREQAPLIDEYLLTTFGTEAEKKASGEERSKAITTAKSRIKYVITFGIGGNEMRWHLLSSINNKSKEKKAMWITLHSASEIDKIPPDATASNTLRITVTKLGDTEETKASEEVLYKRFPNSIIYANEGEVCELGKMHRALVLPFTREIAGRYSALKTPLNIVPMYVSGMDIKSYWEASDRADKAFMLDAPNNLALEIAKFIFFEKVLNGIKILYLGYNDVDIKKSLDEFVQLVMEGLAKENTEIFTMMGVEYPRNAHFEIEGILENPNSFLIWNCLQTKVSREERFRYKYSKDPRKQTLYAGHINTALIAANLATFAEKSPTLVILFDGPDLETAAYLSKIYEDVVYILCGLCNVEPYGNPRVKRMKEKNKENIEKIYELLDREIPDDQLMYELTKQG